MKSLKSIKQYNIENTLLAIGIASCVLFADYITETISAILSFIFF